MNRFFLQIGISSLMIILAACTTVMSNYETLSYRIIKEEGDCQIRDYAATLAVSTVQSEENTGFRTIYSYITGDNSKKEKIAMTVPVRIRQENDKKIMSFFMPNKFSRDTLPSPLRSEVIIEQFSGGRFVAIRFSGLTPAQTVVRKLEELKQWAKLNGLQLTDEWYLDRFDPPWTLPPFRTNEILIRLHPEAVAPAEQ